MLPLEYCANTDVKIEKGWIEARKYKIKSENVVNDTILYQKQIMLDEDKSKNIFDGVKFISDYKYDPVFFNCTITKKNIHLTGQLYNEVIDKYYLYEGTFVKVIENNRTLTIVTNTQIYSLMRLNRTINHFAPQKRKKVYDIILYSISRTDYNNPIISSIENDVTAIKTVYEVIIVTGTHYSRSMDGYDLQIYIMKIQDKNGIVTDTFPLVRFIKNGGEIGFTIFPTYGFKPSGLEEWWGNIAKTIIWGRDHGITPNLPYEDSRQFGDIFEINGFTQRYSTSSTDPTETILKDFTRRRDPFSFIDFFNNKGSVFAPINKYFYSCGKNVYGEKNIPFEYHKEDIKKIFYEDDFSDSSFLNKNENWGLMANDVSLDEPNRILLYNNISSKGYRKAGTFTEYPKLSQDPNWQKLGEILFRARDGGAYPYKESSVYKAIEKDTWAIIGGLVYSLSIIEEMKNGFIPDEIKNRTFINPKDKIAYFPNSTAPMLVNWRRYFKRPSDINNTERGGWIIEFNYHLSWLDLTDVSHPLERSFDYEPGSPGNTNIFENFIGTIVGEVNTKKIYMRNPPVSYIGEIGDGSNLFFLMEYYRYNFVYTAIINDNIEIEIGRETIIPKNLVSNTNYVRIKKMYSLPENEIIITKYRVYLGFNDKEINNGRLLSETDFIYGVITVGNNIEEYKDYIYIDLTGIYMLQTLSKPEGAKYLPLAINDYYEFNGVPVILNKGILYYGALGNGKYMPIFYDTNFVPGIEGKMFIYINGTLGIVTIDRIILLNIVAQEGVLLFSKKDEIGFVIKDKYDVVETPDGVILHTRYGIFATNGQDMILLSEAINDIIRANWEKGNIFYNVYDKELWYLITPVQDEVSETIYLYDFNYKAWKNLSFVIPGGRGMKYITFYMDQENRKYLVSEKTVVEIEERASDCSIGYHPTHFNELGIKKKILGIIFDLDGELEWNGKEIKTTGREFKKLSSTINEIIPGDFIDLTYKLSAGTKLYGFELTLDIEKEGNEYPI